MDKLFQFVSAMVYLLHISGCQGTFSDVEHEELNHFLQFSSTSRHTYYIFPERPYQVLHTDPERDFISSICENDAFLQFHVLLGNQPFTKEIESLHNRGKGYVCEKYVCLHPFIFSTNLT